MWGDPITIGPGLSSDEMEEKRVQLETTLINLTDKAEEIACGK
ncbi:MAG: hypothetical protein PHT96_11155 [Syntrophorhabdaceae bacterium]|nr:hypothetical protein [Syntrophorhabdaceae bacterium]